MESLRRLAGMFVSPRATLARIAAAPSFAAPLVVLMAALSLQTAALSGRIDLRDTVEQALRQADPDALPSEIDRQVELAARAQSVLGYAGGVVNPPLMALFAALVLLLTARFLGGKAGFAACFGAASHALLPLAAGALAMLPAILARERIDVEQLQTLLPSNLGALFPEVRGAVERVLLALDLFSAWVVALLALALSAVSGLPLKRTAPAMVVLWVTWIAAVHVGLRGMAPGEA